ncbi:MAG: hypothetical protein JWQ14_1587 [Adhaeribacter sp.]|nr:hypothetical protein [Adhaeribacter sp.]
MAINLNNSFAAAYYNRGLASGLLLDNKEAALDFKKAIDLNPTDAAAYYLLGLAQNNTGNIRGSYASWQSARQLGHAKARIMLAQKCR